MLTFNMEMEKLMTTLSPISEWIGVRKCTYYLLALCMGVPYNDVELLDLCSNKCGVKLVRYLLEKCLNLYREHFPGYLLRALGQMNLMDDFRKFSTVMGYNNLYCEKRLYLVDVLPREIINSVFLWHMANEFKSVVHLKSKMKSYLATELQRSLKSSSCKNIPLSLFHTLHFAFYKYKEMDFVKNVVLAFKECKEFDNFRKFIANYSLKSSLKDSFFLHIKCCMKKKKEQNE